MTSALTLTTALAAGLFSFASPCVLPLIPAYLSFLTGSSVEELRTGDRAGRARVVLHAAVFCAGFSLVFIAAGLAAGSFASILRVDRVWLARGGGLVAIVLGLQMLGVLRLNVLLRDRRPRLGGGERRSFSASLLMGVGFAAGWSPCIGPILAGILLMAAGEQRLQAALLLGAYSLGLALPFMATALALGTALGLIRRFGKAVLAVEKIAGAALVLSGAVLLGGGLTQISSLLARAGGSN